MSLLVAGTVAYDSIESPYGAAPEILGGSGVHFAAGASLLTPLRVIAVVGRDFHLPELDFLKARGVDFSGLEVADGRTFRWGGKYLDDVNQRETKFTELNVLAAFDPKVPAAFQDSTFVFLANLAPELQARVLDQIRKPKFVVMDTMNFWIDSAPDAIRAVMQRVDGIIVNDEETRMLSGELNLMAGAKKLLTMGPELVICKKGEHGAFLISRDGYFTVPAYPTTKVKDPTGAGDSFAGGLMGYIAKSGSADFATLKRGLVFGSAAASFCVEAFGPRRFMEITLADVERRVKEFHGFVEF